MRKSAKLKIRRSSRRRASRRRSSRRRSSRRRASRSPCVIWHETTPITKPKYFSEPTDEESSIQTGNCEGYWGAPLSTLEKKKYDFHTKKGERGYIKDMPVISSKKWSDKNKFLNMLKVIEDQSEESGTRRNFDIERYSGTTYFNYRGLSPCRIEIGYVPVGNKEFREYKNGKSIICWPEGYGEHYIGKHNVMPTEKFFNYVINKYEEVGRKRRCRISRKRSPKVRTSRRTSRRRVSRKRERKYSKGGSTWGPLYNQDDIILNILQQCGAGPDKLCPENFVCYKNYCIPKNKDWPTGSAQDLRHHTTCRCKNCRSIEPTGVKLYKESVDRALQSDQSFMAVYK